MAFIKVSEISIAYEQHGSGFPLLFIHGYPLHRKLWNGQWSNLSDAVQVIAPDLRGHGESDSSADPHSMQILAQDCFDLLEKLGILASLFVCGLSMGGYVAMAMLRMQPQRIAGLILTATRSAADSTEAKANRDKSILMAQTQGTQPVIDGMLPRLLSPKSLVDSPEIVQTAHEIMSSISVDTVVKDLLGMKERPDSTALLSRSTLPTLIIHGADDQIVLLAEAQALQRIIPNAQLRILPEAGHLPNLEQPSLFNAAIREFIGKVAHG